MKKLIIILFLFVLIVGCQYNTHKTYEEALSSMSDSLVLINPLEIELCDNILNEDTKYNYTNFGMIGDYDRKYKEDTLHFPPIPGLAYKTAYSFCHRDTCYANYAVLALRSPNNPLLLNWLEDKVRKYVAYWPISYDVLQFNSSDVPVPRKRLRSANDICNYYMKWLGESFKKKECNTEEKWTDANMQDALLLADCWRKGNLCTYYEGRWNSENNLAHEAFRTVSAVTGKELTLADLVDSIKYDHLSVMMISKLINSHGEFFFDKPYCLENATDVLLGLSGCGLIQEGLIIYFYPYRIGSGGDGEWKAIIPYEEVLYLLRPDIRHELGYKDSITEYYTLEIAPSSESGLY